MLYRHDHHHRDYNVRAFGGDATTVFVVFLAVVCGVMALGVWLFDEYLTMGPMVGIAFVSGLVVSGVYGVRMAIRNKKRMLDAARDQRENRDAETQKQIDAMQRANSRIPKVKR